MATPATALWLSVLAIFALDQELAVQGATLNLTASDYGAVDEGSGLTLTCAVNGNISTSEWVYFDNSVSSSSSSSSSSSFSPVCYVLTEADVCYTSGPWNQCYCRTKSNSTSRAYDIYIRDVKVHHASNWRCRLFYDRQESNYVRVDVNGRPTRPTLSPVSTSVQTGDDVTLTCSSQASSMPLDIRTGLEYTWRKEGVTLSGQTANTLVLRNVQTSHEGSYTCLAMESGKNLSSEESNDVHVDVQYAPRLVTLSPSTSSYEVRETTGSTPNIRCQADCDPPCLFRWTDKGGNPVGGIGNDLQLTSVRRNQSGMYTCSASNHLGHSAVQVNITATYPPEVTLTQTEVRVEEGDDVTVLCHVDASPPAEVSWSKVTAPGQVTLQWSPLLELRGVGEGDAGLYTCSATNPLSPQESPSQASLRVHVIMKQPAAVLSWREAVGVGVGSFAFGLLLGLLCCLIAARRRQSEDMPPEPTTTSSSEDTSRRPSVTFQRFQWYNNQTFIPDKDLLGINETLDSLDGVSQTEEEADRQGQNLEKDNEKSKAAGRGARESKVDGEGDCGRGPVERESRVNGRVDAKVQGSNGLKSKAAETANGKTAAAGGEEGKVGGESQRRETVKNGDVRASPVTTDPLYSTTM